MAAFELRRLEISWKISMNQAVCTVHTVHGIHASQVTICSHNTENVLYELYISTLNQACNFN